MKAPLGQNFLVDTAAVEAIVASLGDIAQSRVIEIGPGGGALTSLLARRAGRLVAIEYDRELAATLQAAHAEQPHVTIVRADIRTANLTAISAGEKSIVVGNLPYYITSDILLHLVAHQDAVASAVLMMQREVAERVSAQPGTRDFGVLSVTVQMAAAAELLFTLPPEAFAPPPQVYSSVVRLTLRPRYDELGVERGPFETFVRGCFAQKRKTLAANLRNVGHSREAIATALATSSVEEKARAEQLAVDALASVYRSLRD